MVLMAADDSDHHHNPKAAKPKPKPASPSPAAAPATTRTRLHDFTLPSKLSWGAHRLLRCSKDGAPASPPPHPHTPEKPQGAPAQPPRPWNLRTRRAATAAPVSAAAGSEKAAAQKQPLAAPATAGDARKRAGFSVALTKEEIAEDFLAIRGARPPRRPKKRPRAVQRQIDLLYPGSSLADVNMDSYKIEER